MKKRFEGEIMKIKNVWNFSAVLILLLTILACSKFEKVTKIEYRKNNLALTHFSNWKITEDNTSLNSDIETRYISIEGPNDAILLLTRFPDAVPTTLEEYVAQMQSASNSEMKEITGGYDVVKVGDAKISPVTAQIAGASRAGLRREFDIKVLSLPVPHRAEHYLIENGGEKWFVVAQASQEDWDEVKEGFQTIYESLSLAMATGSESGK